MKQPKIRFKGFSGEWEESVFADSFDSLKKNSLSRSELSENGSVYNIHYGDILITYNECVEIDKAVKTFIKDVEVARKLYQSCAINNGDIIFAGAAEDNTVGKCIEVIAQETDAIVSGLHTIPCRPQKKFASRYLGFYLNSKAYHDQLLPYIQGTKISSISKSALAQTHISYPCDKDEQQAIVSYFQHLDSLIQSTAKKIELLKQTKVASLKSMFPQEGESTPRVRFKGFEGEWQKVRFDKIFEFVKNNSLTRDQFCVTNGEVKNIHYGDILIKFGDILDVSKDCLPYIIGMTRKSKAAQVASLQDGDVIISDAAEDNTVGKCLEVLNVKDECVVAGLHTIACRPVHPFALGYLGHYINSDSFHNQLLPLIQGSKISSISKSVLKHIYVTFPLIAEQRLIANYFISLDAQISLQTQRLEKLKQIKSACLDNMFV